MADSSRRVVVKTACAKFLTWQGSAVREDGGKRRAKGLFFT